MDDWWAMRVVRNQTFHSHGCQSKAKKCRHSRLTSTPCFGQQVNAAMATVASSRFTELYKRPTRSLPTRLGRLYPVAAHNC